VYFVVRGEGATVVGHEEIAWGQHDIFAVPNWAWRHHVNRSTTTPAILFSVNDIPALQALGFYREEPAVSLRAVDSPPVPGDLARAILPQPAESR
jgi:gentisate 1,2-dioxygenase